MALSPLTSNGWIKEDGKLHIEWDSKENVQSVRKRVDLLLKGCGCRYGCDTNRCSCRKNAYHVADVQAVKTMKTYQQDETAMEIVIMILEVEVDGIMEAMLESVEQMMRREK